MNARRQVLLVVHPERADSVPAAREVATRFAAAGVGVRVLNGRDGLGDLDDPALAGLDGGGGPGALVVPEDDPAVGAELVFVLGGDGTLLRAAELARPAGIPLLGVNLGRVSFLTEAESDALADTVARVVAGKYRVDARMTVEVTVTVDGTVTDRTWALNEASVEKCTRERILDALIEVDGHPVSAFGCDGVLCATPTGSTAYAFSAGGPIIWPDVEALVVVPSNAHAMFSRPMVVSGSSVITVGVDPDGSDAVLTCDGLRHIELPRGARVRVVRGEVPVRLARLSDGPFTDRLVQKFALPVKSWRDRHARQAPPPP